ncbi:MAG: 2-amino-4-hydroxy-6-hydroxymethyldihydropteridine diphosphokinase [Bacteroidales bacterium]|jgi:2-amino-4-hydroxy-6-hydroxymethyldihydropteridine diphosphokinase|nr:2-amino-4-hydroxy-6-hydroxymethyldihydropteridine diphosphokinase [Bacteroidales bacterium]HOL98094.1 2-amino-4-hydroxy-6-hydroxymethyldihydropteridine diphosphokinase [Bacteroidales bacterium]HOM36203.1 2-amino-4-hydroxy-6-hydroxymethyldihydropteridine diphosphokinase [Bacteroidales bacterium]HPD23734.1 2-amino-4-hydroxy-6-hydroxymethyldihydropteridine diphosphokinase [Bacteroidales bacterium]HRS99788.1 2-amino-4-hydroxy-6-hydroxymethyldihydropteridine diphosphokinase [Bacteroidales bacteri
MNKVYLGIGGNLGNRVDNLRKTIKLIEQKISNPLKISSPFLSEPWGFENKKYFLNAVVYLETNLDYLQVLENALEIENELKRVRNSQGYEARTMDIDILFFNNLVVKNNLVRIPHPRITDRLFVLLPMNEINPNFVHPELNLSINQLVKICPDKSKIRKCKIPLF